MLVGLGLNDSTARQQRTITGILVDELKDAVWE